MDNKAELIAQLDALVAVAKEKGFKESADLLKRMSRDAKKRAGLSVDAIADAALVDVGAVDLKEASWTTITQKNGIWGLRIESLDVKPGEIVQTKTKGGKRERRAVDEIIWQGHGRTIATCRELTEDEKKAFKGPKTPKPAKVEETPSQDDDLAVSESFDDVPY